MSCDLYYLGAHDPEMGMIMRLLLSSGHRVQLATIGRKRVHPGNAYAADDPPVPRGFRLVYVECGTRSNLRGDVIDHHRPGDPGYLLGPADYWRASSLGQVVARAGLSLPRGIARRCHYIAAIDHCFARALQGECPGVDPRRVDALRMKGIAAETGKTVKGIRALVDLWRMRVLVADSIPMAAVQVRDCRAYDCGTVYSADYLCLQQAAAELQVGCLLKCHNWGSHEPKVVASGLSPEAVRYFLDQWAVAQGLTRIYGVPERGYCGGYVQSIRFSI